MAKRKAKPALPHTYHIMIAEYVFTLDRMPENLLGMFSQLQLRYGAVAWRNAIVFDCTSGEFVKEIDDVQKEENGQRSNA